MRPSPEVCEGEKVNWLEKKQAAAQKRRCFKRCSSCGNCANYSPKRLRCANCQPVVRCRCEEGVRMWVNRQGLAVYKFVAHPEEQVRVIGV